MNLHISIRSKLLIMITFIIIILALVQILFQTFFLEEFYLNRLTQTIEQQFITLEANLKNIDIYDFSSVKNELNILRSKSNQPIHITSSKDIRYLFETTSSSESYLVFEPNNTSEIYTIYVDNQIIDHISRDKNLDLDNIYVEGYYNRTSAEIHPVTIKIGDYTYFPKESIITSGNINAIGVSPSNSSSQIEDSLTNEEKTGDTLSLLEQDNNDEWLYENMQGVLNYYQIGSTITSEYAYLDNILIEKLTHLVDKENLEAKNDPLQVNTFYDSYYDKNNLLVYRVLDVEGTKTDEKFYVASIISYASIEEPLDIYQEYNWITLVLGTFFAFLLVYMFTGNMVRPIREMERVTSNMANLDFGERVQVDSTDEIGQLANSFNVLSDKLQHSINNMKTLNYELELEVEERIKQQKVLKEFIGNASHELKTPITIMKGLLDGVEDGVYDANSNEHKDSVKDEVLRMEKIVYDLLQVSKMERGAQQIHTSIFDPSDIIYGTYQRHKARGAEKHMSFHFNFEDTFVEADAQLIESVIDNLIGNAINYSTEGADINCEITTFQNQALISIENTLAHIPDDDLPNIFDPFYRVDKSHTRMTGGSGLGLSIIKNILELHGSKYELHNTKNGVKFIFSLKCISDE